MFTTSGFLLADLRSPWLVLMAWLVGGVIAGLGALSYGALARRLPESGGEYLFLSRTLHPAAGYLAGWVSLLVGFSAPAAAAAYAFGQYLQPWWPRWSPPWAGTILLLFFSLLHAAHVQRGAWIQNRIKVGMIPDQVEVILHRIPHPDGVVHCDDAPWNEFPRVKLVEIIRLAFLVCVQKHEIERAIERRNELMRVALPKRHPVRQPGGGNVLFRQLNR